MSTPPPKPPARPSGAPSSPTTSRAPSRSPSRSGAGAERRAHPRASTTGRVLVLSPTKAEGTLTDISRTGMCLLFERPVQFQKGQELNVSFVLPGSETKIATRLEVMRRGDSRELGLRFIRLSPEILSEIDAYVVRTESA